MGTDGASLSASDFSERHSHRHHIDSQAMPAATISTGVSDDLKETSFTTTDVSTDDEVCDLPPEGANDKELDSIVTFRAMLTKAGLVPNDAGEQRFVFSQVTLLRFIRARKTLDKSFAMFKEMLEWWRAYKPLEQRSLYMAEASSREVSIVKEYFPCGFHGKDKRGCPVYYGRYGRMDLEGIVSEAGMETMTRHAVSEVLAMQESAVALARETGSATVYPSNVAIIDLEGMSWGRMYRALNSFGQIIKTQDDNFPERLLTCVVVRAPRIFGMMYKLAAPLMSADTRAKIKIVGKSSDHMPHLLEHMDIDQIPAFLGGKSIEPWAHGCGGAVVSK